MYKKVASYVAILFIVVVAVFLFTDFFLLDNIAYKYLENNTEETSIHTVRTDQKGYIYYIEQTKSDKNLIRVDDIGKQVFKTLIRDEQKESELVVQDIHITANGNIYLLCSEKNKLSGTKLANVIITYSHNGEFKKEIFRKVNPQDVDMSYINCAETETDLFFGIQYDNTVEVYKTNKSSEGDVYKIYSFEDKSLKTATNLSATTSESVVFSKLEGGLYEFSSNGEIQTLIASNSEGVGTIGRIKVGLDNSIYVLDLTNNELLNIVKKGNNTYIQKVVKSTSNLYEDDITKIRLEDLNQIDVNPSGNLSGLIKSDKGISIYFGGFTYLNKIDLFNEGVKFSFTELIILVLVIIGILVVTTLVWDYYCSVLKMKISIITKISIMLILLLFVSIYFIVNNFIYTQLYDEMNSEYDFSIVSLSGACASSLGMAEVDYDKYGIDNYFDFQERLSFLNSVREKRSMIAEVIIHTDNEYKIIYSNTKLPIGFPVRKVYGKEKLETLLDSVIASGSGNKGEYTAEDGKVSFYLQPLKNKDNELAAVLMLSTPIKEFDNRTTEIKDQILLYLYLTAIIIIFIVIFILSIFVKAIKQLKKSVEKISTGNFDVDIDIKSGDEIEQLAITVTSMSNYIKQHLNRMEKLNSVYYRFVPLSIMTLLGEKHIEDIRRGQNVKQKMTVLYFSIRDFFNITENLTSEEVFDLINSYLEVLVPIIRDNNGIIDRFMDSGFYAVFPDKKEDAVKAALVISDALKRFNSKSRIKVDAGIAITIGDVMIGIVGDEKQISVAAISSSISIAQKIEALAQEMDIQISATSEVLTDLSQQYKYRYTSKLKYGKEEFMIYDIFSGDEQGLVKKKETQMKEYLEAIRVYENGDVDLARDRFIYLLKLFPEDGVIRRYLKIV